MHTEYWTGLKCGKSVVRVLCGVVCTRGAANWSSSGLEVRSFVVLIKIEVEAANGSHIASVRVLRVTYSTFINTSITELEIL